MSKKPIFALVDCNNFFASCETLFRPDLKNKPLIVLSNNDGCVVARSQEAKQLGIKMGVPFYQIKDLVNRYQVATFSSNYALYADLSSRVMSTLETLAPTVEVYSIDEAFLDLTGIDNLTSLFDFGLTLRHTLKQWTKIIVCVGIAPTKTLAKLANHAAKHYSKTQGVVDLTARERQRKLMALVPVGEVWGIGRKLTQRMENEGIYTALDLANANLHYIRKHYSVVVERIVRELNGESCLPLESITPTKQQIVFSRSFSQRIHEFAAMREAISDYTARAAEKLRKEQRYAKMITVFMRTSPFNPSQPRYAPSRSLEMAIPTDDTRELIKASHNLLQQIWQDGHRFMKAGVMLSDFYEPGVYQPSLFDPATPHANSQTLMKLLDQVNHSSAGRLYIASQGIRQDWSMKRQNLSPSYTTRWEDIPWVV